MDSIVKSLVFGGLVKVTALVTTDIVNRAIELHHLTPVTAAALGKTLTIGAYMSNELKGEDERLSISINCNGPIGNIVVAAKAGGYVRGYVANPNVDIPPLANNKQNLKSAVGTGMMKVIKDLGLKDPYTGTSELVNGNIDEDFAWYFTSSEGQPTALALACNIESGKCVAAGGIVIQPMPNCPDHIITVLEDISSNFVDLDKLIMDRDAKKLIDDFFGHFEIEYFEPTHPEYRCICSRDYMENILLSMGRAKCVDLAMSFSPEPIEIVCECCSTKYHFAKDDIVDMWKRYDDKNKK